MCTDNMKYFTSLKYLYGLYDKNYRGMGLCAGTLNEYESWKNEVRKKLYDISGMSLMSKCELFPQLMESIYMDGYTRNKVILQTEPEVWMPLYVLIPDDLKPEEKRPCVIAPH